MDMKNNNQIIRNLGATALGILILVYVFYQSILINAETVKTETAMYGKMSDGIEADAWFIRNELIVTNTKSGIISYNVESGEKVTQGTVLADIYRNEDDAEEQKRISRLESEINSLEMLLNSSGQFTANKETIGKQINEANMDFLKSTLEKDFVEMADKRDDLLYYLNYKRLIGGEDEKEIYSDRVTVLEREKELLEHSSNGSSNKILSLVSGYYISGVDAYENSFDYDAVKDMTVHDIENISISNAPNNAVGKISKNFKWYVVAVLDEQERLKLERKNEVTIYIPKATKKEIPAKIEAINEDEETGKYAIILSCDYMTAELASVRNETIQIVADAYNGVLVNEKSITFSDVTRTEEDENGKKVEKTYENVKGVYIKYGDRVIFVQIFTDVSINGYAVCKTNLSELEKEKLVTDRTIRLYDEVIVQGADLYDGKVL